ncbi:MAG: glutamine amidotransferase [Geminicoccaceae bacterium]
MKRLVIVLQDAEAPPGLIAEVAEQRRCRVDLVPAAAFAAAELADAALVVLGGTANADDDSGNPHFAALLRVLRERAAADQPVLGLGLGAQLLARALGAAVHAGGAQEFGYVDLVPTEAASADPVLASLGAGLPVMEWHQDRLDLPTEARLLAICHRHRPQAFAIGRHVYGLQFHPGATADIVRRWARLRGVEKNNPAVPVRISAEIVRHQERSERFGRDLVGRWIDLAND